MTNKSQNLFWVISAYESDQIRDALSAWLAGFRPEFKIFDAIIITDSVFVVNVLKLAKFSANELFHNDTMLWNASLAISSINSLIFNRVRLFPKGIMRFSNEKLRLAGTIAKPVCITTQRRLNLPNGFFTVRTRKFNSRLVRMSINLPVKIIVMLGRAKNILVHIYVTRLSIDQFGTFWQRTFKFFTLPFNLPLAFKVAIHGFYRCRNGIKSITTSSAVCRINRPISLAISKNLFQRHKTPWTKRWPAVVQENPRASTADQKTNALTGEDFLNTYIVAKNPATAEAHPGFKWRSNGRLKQHSHPYY
jgi:hypothetical protein